MKKRIIISVICLFYGLNLLAQGKSEFNGSLLWKITGNGLNEASYILGTYHVYDGQFADSIPGLRKAIAETKQLAGEIDMEDNAAIRMQMLQVAAMPEGESYRELLSKEDYARLDEGIKGIMGVGLDQMGALKPGMINSILAIFLYMRLNPAFDPAAFEGIDTYLQRIVREEGKKVTGLETVEEQLYLLFDSEPLKVQVESLLCGVTHLDNSLEQLAELTDYYRDGNLIGMYNLAFDDPDDPCYSFTQSSKDPLLKHRNDKWMEKLPGLMAENPTLVAVGALHLPGEEGLLYQLHLQGYRVEPVK